MDMQQVETMARQWLDASGVTLPATALEQAVEDILAELAIAGDTDGWDGPDGALDRVLAAAVDALEAEGERVRRDCQMRGRSALGRFEVIPNGEFVCQSGDDETRAKQLRDWPTSPSWWVRLVDGDDEEAYGPGLGSWAALVVEAEELAARIDAERAARTERLRASVRRAAAEMRAAERALEAVTQRRQEVMLAALDAGLPVADVAAAAGVGRARVYQLRDRGRA